MKTPKDGKEDIMDMNLPDDYHNSFSKLLDTRCIIPRQEHYAISVLQSIIDRIRKGSIMVTGFSINEDEFPSLSINWNRRIRNENK